MDKIDEIQRQMDDGVISERKALKALKMQPLKMQPRSKKGHGSRRFKKRRAHGRQ